MAMTWTPEQQKVIKLRDKDILVSAAAGSGKTAVLVERIIRRITDKENPIDIDRLLVVTFTKAAAAEMRERIQTAIDQACEKNPDDSHLRRQSALIHNSMITTIDSFCLFVVRNHFGEINLDPNFRIADEGEVKLLELDVLAQVFESNYADENQTAFRRLIDTYAGKRSDQAVRDMVRKIYHMSLSSPWPKEWIADLVKPYHVQTEEALSAAGVMQDIVETTGQTLRDMQKQIRRLHELALAEDGPNAYAPALEADLKMLEQVETLDDYGRMKAFFENLQFAKLAPVRGFMGDVLKKEAVQSGRNEIKKELEELKKKYFQLDVKELLEQIGRILPFAEELVRLTLQYTDAMEEQKRKKRIVDFSDIEHFALQILVDGKTKCCRRTAEEFRHHFAEIMIDEYQDSNQVQEEIMRAISREPEGGHNLFMVGDVKQSIYRFRMARPELFMEKYASFDADGGSQQRIDLSMNFRSRPEVVDYCNDVFYKIMSPDLGKVAYDDRAALYCGAAYPDNPGMQPELLLLDEADELLSGQKDRDKRQIEAYMVAKRIRRLMEEAQVTDQESGGLRPLKYSDIVILFRSLKDWGTEFADVLKEQGIPAHVESASGYFSAIEVQTVLNMLRILDNPYQDIPMAAVLKSPMVGLDEEELAEIRVCHDTMTFAEAALTAMQEDADGKLARFYEVYVRLRKQKDLPVHVLIQKILDETGYGNYAAALPAGSRRSANLAMLVEKAADYEKTSYRGLFHFVRYIDQLQKYEIDFGEADTTGENADVVRIMTIHKSKGLEFPVVFVSGMGKRINQMETNEKLVVHPELGMGIWEITTEPKMKKNCMFRFAIADRIRRENLGEELRILYVAMTRAKEKLILTGMIKDEEKTLTKYTANVGNRQPIGYRQRLKAATYLDWVLPAMMSYPEKYAITVVDPKKLVWDEVEAAGSDRMDYEQLLAAVAAVDEKRVEDYDRLFSYQYPYQGEAGRKSKYSVSELKHDSMLRKFDQTENDAEVPDFLRDDRESYIPDFVPGAAKKDAFLPDEVRGEIHSGESKTHAGKPGSGGVNRGALRGDAVHRVMECMDFVRLAGIDRRNTEAVEAFVREELERMRTSGELAEELYELVIPSAIASFAASDTAHRMADAAQQGNLYREKPFVMQHQDVLVQGIIDVFWLEENSIVLLDYKTDSVKQAKELVDRYETQLLLYADALSRVFSGASEKITVKERLIYSFRLQEVIAI